MNNDIPAFDQFMKDRELAAQAFVNGAMGPSYRGRGNDIPP
jgi:hypothetical protein